MFVTRCERGQSVFSHLPCKHMKFIHPLRQQEQEQMQCYNQRMIEILKARQQQEKNRQPKIQRGEAKTRMAMFKKSLRINSTGSSSEDREKIKQVGPRRGIRSHHTSEQEGNRSITRSLCVSFSSPCRRTSGRRPRGFICSRSTRAR